MKLWATGVSPIKKVEGIRAIRTVGALASPECAHASLKGARDLWERVLSGATVMLLCDDEPDKMHAAVDALDAGFVGYDVTHDDGMPGDEAQPEPPDAPEPEGEPEPPVPPTVVATQASMVLLACNQGNAGAALSTARHLSRILQDPFWEDVATYLLTTFPAPNPEVHQALLDARQS